MPQLPWGDREEKDKIAKAAVEKIVKGVNKALEDDGEGDGVVSREIRKFREKQAKVERKKREREEEIEKRRREKGKEEEREQKRRERDDREYQQKEHSWLEHEYEKKRENEKLKNEENEKKSKRKRDIFLMTKMIKLEEEKLDLDYKLDLLSRNIKFRI